MLTDFIFMKPSYDFSRDDVDEPEETKSKRSSATHGSKHFKYYI